ncbi:hypothetical protein [Shewanella xiamenensis]|uniref:hypothetical protein n=1 Tax=Shewanella xiamenensis TaxID=332186 RepID=UPI0024A73E48|nr:hypothetical protein [Shewanella xiamenensis]MDI5836945.1 hypothetical protein [Shewanella xiamenensis]MDI5841623.1 hypothetical protein [Shewanella xiamenensis]MDI5846170.1 hypothetical protein [Shewanella xiamenensis]MDI5850105.1 hypothetical protein [Shewanella xiamenensis]MDI5853378.1 hypothetical protein [Shewanella xiamenensis]
MLIKDIEQAISDATKPNLTLAEYNRLKTFLLNCQSQLVPPNTFIPRVNAALAALEHHRPLVLSWYQKPAGLIFIAVCGGVLTYGALLLLGWVQLPHA